MDREKIQERLNDIKVILERRKEGIGRIEGQQRILNEKSAGIETEKLALINSFQKIIGEVEEIRNEVKILEEKILQQI